MAAEAGIERIWSRMPVADQDRVLAAPAMYRNQLIELWECANRNERRGVPHEREDADARELMQDELDELLLTRASKGEYGGDAIQAVKDCMSQYTPGTSRRALLRAVRKAIEARRHGSDWKPAGGRSKGRAAPEQPALPLGATGTDGRDSRLP